MLSLTRTGRNKNERTADQERLFVASQWQLIRWKFFRHKLAIGALAVLLVLYLFAIFAEFTAPYDPLDFDVDYVNAPPQRVRFVDAKGSFHLRPFVYRIEGVLNMETLATTYIEDETKRDRIYLFVIGDSYQALGSIQE